MNKWITSVSVVALLATSSVAASAQDKIKEGFYLGAGMGLTHQRDSKFEDFGSSLSFESGYGYSLRLGHRWNRLRAEIEYTRFNADLSSFSSPAMNLTKMVTGRIEDETAMLNGYYDLTTGKLRPYIGGGIGKRRLTLDSINSPLGTYADSGAARWYGQAMTGLTYTGLDDININLEYRYVNGRDGGKFTFATQDGVGSMSGSSHAAFLGLNYYFGKKDNEPEEEVVMAPEMEEPAPVVVQEPEPAPAPEPVPEPEPIIFELPEDFIIYFAFDSAELDWKAKEVVMAVVEAFNEHGNAALSLAGHTDTRGAKDYNEKLAKKRAWAVKAALMEAGISEEALSMTTHGEHKLAVATEDGVKNAENRRVEVMFSLAE